MRIDGHRICQGCEISKNSNVFVLSPTVRLERYSKYLTHNRRTRQLPTPKNLDLRNLRAKFSSLVWIFINPSHGWREVLDPWRCITLQLDFKKSRYSIWLGVFHMVGHCPKSGVVSYQSQKKNFNFIIIFMYICAYGMCPFEDCACLWCL